MTGPEAEWRNALAQGRILLQRDEQSGMAIFPPRVLADSEWIEASGRGTIYSVTLIPQKPPAPMRNVVLVDLAEGARMMSRVEEIAPEDIRIGMAVQAAIVEEGEGPLIIFRPA